MPGSALWPNARSPRSASLHGRTCRSARLLLRLDELLSAIHSILRPRTPVSIYVSPDVLCVLRQPEVFARIEGEIRVEIWNRLDSTCKVGGEAPMRKNLEKFLQR